MESFIIWPHIAKMSFNSSLPMVKLKHFWENSWHLSEFLHLNQQLVVSSLVLNCSVLIVLRAKWNKLILFLASAYPPSLPQAPAASALRLASSIGSICGSPNVLFSLHRWAFTGTLKYILALPYFIYSQLIWLVIVPHSSV